MMSDPNTIERKAIDVSGRLGSLYDASTDNLINQHSVQASETKLPNKPSICRIFSGKQSTDIITYLKEMDFNDDLQQSVLLDMVETSGVSSLLNYNQSIDQNTRFLYYSYRSKKEELDVIPRNIYQIIPPPSSPIRATHMITKIVWGFEILCVIPIPGHKSADDVDSLLESIFNRLENTESEFVLTDNEKRQVAHLINVTVYGSETCVDNPNTPLLTVLTKLGDLKEHRNFHHPLKYTMYSLRWLYNYDQFSETYDLTDGINSDIGEIKPIIIRLKQWAQNFQRSSESLPKNLPSATLDQALKDVQQHLHIWLNINDKFRENLQKVLVDVRRRHCESAVIRNVISDQYYSSLKTNETETFAKVMQQLLTKVMLINRLNHDKIEYISVLDLRYHGKIPVTDKHIEKALRRSLCKEDSCTFIFYSNDRLKYEDPAGWKHLYQQLISKQQQATQKTILAYADFTDCQYDLKDLTSVMLTIQASAETSRNHPIEGPILSNYSPTLPRPSKQPPPPSVSEINVLLLGETGVGKSTFINAFVNYLMFDTLQQAEQGEPVVIIPVSFLITIGDQFEEFVVKFGETDSNEDHEHPGESVTQHCKSYVFQLNNKLHLRLIDTPGMGDTRGVDQDEKNINHILTYVNNLPHLNAICLLLKPNASRLNIFFRSCVNQLLTYLTPIGYDNIIFCFTNARSTFFAPGDTGPLLRQMLKQEHLDGIPFGKTNTFCFDSESFRYLAARKRGVTFDEFQNEECIKSWTTSVTQSVRLLDFIQKREPYHLDEWQSPKKVALEISMLARPLMETLRLILYNWKLRETGKIANQIILSGNPVRIEMCTNCAQFDIVPIGPFWIVSYGSDKNKECLCHANEKHFLVEARLWHDIVDKSIDISSNDFQNSFHDFLCKCDRLIHFLRQKGLLDHGDPFTSVLGRFLDEQRLISDNVNIKSNSNREVKEVLRSLSHIRQQNRKKLNESDERLSMDQIVQLINELKSIPDVTKQIECIKTSRQLKMEAHEYRVKIPSIKNKIFAELTNSFL